MFNENSGLVKIWMSNVQAKGYTRQQVPKLSNLQEVVWSILDKEKSAA